MSIAALPNLFKLEDAISMLVKSGKVVLNGGIDYRLVIPLVKVLLIKTNYP